MMNITEIEIVEEEIDIMGIPWIKSGKIDLNTLPKIRNYSDAITFEQACIIIANHINEVEEEKEKMRARVREYEENINADTRVIELKEQLTQAREEMYNGFRISNAEREAISKWKDKHDIKVHGLNTSEKKLAAGGAIGGRYHYEFYPTSIGTAGVCVCGRCQRKAWQEAKGIYDAYVALKKKYDVEFEFADLG